jgi:hypothetical protein
MVRFEFGTLGRVNRAIWIFDYPVFIDSGFAIGLPEKSVEDGRACCLKEPIDLVAG